MSLPRALPLRHSNEDVNWLLQHPDNANTIDFSQNANFDDLTCRHRSHSTRIDEVEVDYVAKDVFD